MSQTSYTEGGGISYKRTSRMTNDLKKLSDSRRRFGFTWISETSPRPLAPSAARVAATTYGDEQGTGCCRRRKGGGDSGRHKWPKMPNDTIIFTLTFSYNIFTMPNVVHVSACVLQESISLTFVKASLHFSINLLVTNRQKNWGSISISRDVLKVFQED